MVLYHYVRIKLLVKSQNRNSLKRLLRYKECMNHWVLKVKRRV